jgi:hypothetical protein
LAIYGTFQKKELNKMKKNPTKDRTAKNIAYNQELGRYLKLKKQRDNKPIKVELQIIVVLEMFELIFTILIGGFLDLKLELESPVAAYLNNFKNVICNSAPFQTLFSGNFQNIPTQFNQIYSLNMNK